MRATNDGDTTARPKQFMGYCLDSGAARSVVGKYQFQALCNRKDYKLKLKPSETTFRFGRTTFNSLGMCNTRLKVDQTQYIEFCVEVVNGDFPLFVGLEVMRHNELILNYGHDCLSDTTGTWSLPIKYVQGHSFFEDDMYGYYSRKQSWRNSICISITLRPGSFIIC